MKRFVGLMTVMALLLGILSSATVNVSAVPLNISGTFGYSTNSNMTESVKFLSYEEFAAYVEENDTDIQFETEMYDEGFFEYNYLYLLHIRTDSSGSKFEHTDTVFNANSIDFEITQTYHGITDDAVSWFYILEADKNFADTEINLILTYELSPKISYLLGYFGSPDENEPHIEKINTLEESRAYGTYIASRYSESFFENNFLLTVSWQEPQAVRTHEVSSVIRRGNSINIELSEFPVDGDYPDVVTPYCAVIELPKSLADMECAVTRNNLIRIYTAQELAQLRDDVNDGNAYEGKHIILTCDIDLSSVCGADINGAEASWTPIGAKDNHADEAYDIDIKDNIFNGCFDGNGHTVSGLYINSDENADAGEADRNYFGLFGCTGEKSVIKNLTLDGSVAVSGTIRFGSVSDLKDVYTGALAGYNGGMIENCHNNATVDAAATLMSVGGIAGASTGEISRCSNNADISGTSGINAGGIAGKSTAKISKCSNYGNIIKVGRCTGGIAGRLEGAEATVDNCCNLSDVSSSYLHGYGYEGGIAGYASDIAKVTNSYSVGTISGENGGAITASGSKLSAENCYYLENTAAFQLSDTTAKTASQFESGEVAYLLGGEWGQKIGVDKYPVIGGDKVYFSGGGYTNNPVTYPYKITALKVTDTNGEPIEHVRENTGFIVEADIEKTAERNEKDCLFIAVYGTDGALISLDYVRAKFAVDGGCSFGFYVPAQEKTAGSVKAFVWNTFNSAEPLAETRTLYISAE